MCPDRIDLNLPGGGGVPVFDYNGVHVGDLFTGGESEGFLVGILLMIVVAIFVALLYVIGFVVYILFYLAKLGLWNLVHGRFLEAMLSLSALVIIVGALCLGSYLAIWEAPARAKEEHIKAAEKQAELVDAEMSRVSLEYIDSKYCDGGSSGGRPSNSNIIDWCVYTNTDNPWYTRIAVRNDSDSLIVVQELRTGASCQAMTTETRKMEIDPKRFRVFFCIHNSSPDTAFAQGVEIHVSLPYQGQPNVDRWLHFVYP